MKLMASKINSSAYNQFIEYLAANGLKLEDVIDEIILGLVEPDESVLGLPDDDAKALTRKWFAKCVLKAKTEEPSNQFNCDCNPFTNEFYQNVIAAYSHDYLGMKLRIRGAIEQKASRIAEEHNDDKEN